MAISAFKSTTKRVCSLGAMNEPDNAYIVSSSLRKRSSRRSRSFSDFVSHDISDSALTTGDSNSIHLDSLFERGKVTRRNQSDEPESDVESGDTFRSCLNAEVGTSPKAALQNGKTKGKRQTEFRRCLSHVETSSKEIFDFLSCIDDQSDAESVLSRPTPRNHRLNAQSDSESVFSRLTRPRQTAELVPPRTQPLPNGKARAIRAGCLRRASTKKDISGSYESRDEQSETESVHFRDTSRSRQNAGFGASGITPTRKKGTRQAALRQSTCQIDLPDSPDGGFRGLSLQQHDADTPEEAYYEMEVDPRRGDEEIAIDYPEEEKTIRAVHTQNKEHRAQELDAISFYDAMRVEMRKAVLDIRSEIEQKSLSKELSLPKLSTIGSLKITLPGESDDDSAITDGSRDYAAKLEQVRENVIVQQTEKRAQDLWTQLASLERRCHDLVKGPDSEKKLVSQSLDEDAQRYFDECVSVSGLSTMSVRDASSGIGYEESESLTWSVKDISVGSRKDFGRANERKTAMLEPLISFCAQIAETGKCIGKSSNPFLKAMVNSDGLLLPWLKWETESEFSLQESLEKEKQDGNTVCSLSTNSQPLTRSESQNWRQSRDHSKEVQEVQLADLPPGVLGLGCAVNGDLSSCKVIEFGHLSVGVTSTHGRGRSAGLLDVEVLVLQRMWLGHQLKDGRILVCGGVRC